MSRRQREKGEILIRDEELALYGHLTAAEFWEALEEQESEYLSYCPLALRQGWYRWLPAPPEDGYLMYAWPAKPHARGAFPVTTWDYRE